MMTQRKLKAAIRRVGLNPDLFHCDVNCFSLRPMYINVSSEKSIDGANLDVSAVLNEIAARYQEVDFQEQEWVAGVKAYALRG